MGKRGPIYLYTDGAASGNPGPGGWGAVLIYGDLRKELSGGFSLTTNNRMELLAIIEGLKAIKWAGADIVIRSDSKYVIESINKGWKRKKNLDLWQRFDEARRGHNLQLEWIKGHNGHPLNERCDALATSAAAQPGLPEDSGYVNELTLGI